MNIDDPNNATSVNSEAPSVSNKQPAKKKFLAIVLLTVVIVLVILLVSLSFSHKLQQQQNPSSTASQTPLINLRTEYQNPFDKNAQYENPFENLK